MFDPKTEDDLRTIVRDEMKTAVENALALIQNELSHKEAAANLALGSLHQVLAPPETLTNVVRSSMVGVVDAIESGSLPVGVDILRDLADLLERFSEQSTPEEPTEAEHDEWQALQEQDQTLAPSNHHHPDSRGPANAGSAGIGGDDPSREEGASRGHRSSHDPVDEEPPPRAAG